MRRAAYAAPIALLAAGCVEPVYSPADYADYAGDRFLPEAVATEVPARSTALAEWQLPASSPWAAYQKLTLLAALDETPQTWELPDVESIGEVLDARVAARAVAAAGLPDDAAWFVDLRGAASVAFAHALGDATAAPMAAVPTFNHWPADGEMIPAEETLAAMVRMPPARRADPGARPMFLLDSWRLSDKDAEVDDETYDNRYALGPADFPSADDLWARGVRRVVYVVATRGPEAREEDDLNEVFRAYQEHGIEVAVLGLDELRGVRRASDWGAGWPAWRVTVVTRPVVILSHGFHMRARGGWGGVHAVPGVGHGGG